MRGIPVVSRAEANRPRMPHASFALGDDPRWSSCRGYHERLQMGEYTVAALLNEHHALSDLALRVHTPVDGLAAVAVPGVERETRIAATERSSIAPGAYSAGLPNDRPRPTDDDSVK